MGKQEDLYEIERKLQQINEKRYRLQNRLREIQQEEGIVYRDEVRHRKNIEDLSLILPRDLCVMIQNDSYAQLDELKERVSRAFRNEEELVDERIRESYREERMLMDRKKELMNDEA